MHFFITGHTGFKGAWLISLLRSRGYSVSGYSLDPLSGSLFETCQMHRMCERDFRGDIRNYHHLEKALQSTRPDVLIHMAAQPLVREGYRNPTVTFETNVLGTMNVLRASQSIGSIQAQLIITTDKVYKNKYQIVGYRENDELGGDDPYSASKSMADILTQSWIKSYECPPTAIARAGNVIGGGDVSSDRLIPDLISAYVINEIPKLRYPNAIRPWQHVLDCLNGYLSLIDYLLKGGTEVVWNFGPSESEFHKVHEVAEEVAIRWGKTTPWILDDGTNFEESEMLILDSSKARLNLEWKEKFNFSKSIEMTTQWYQSVLGGVSPIIATEQTLANFLR